MATSCRVTLVFAGHGGHAREDQVAHVLGQAMSADAVVTLLLRHVDAPVHVAGTRAPGSLGGAADAAGDLMAAVLAGLPANGTREATLRSQIETFIELRLREPGLPCSIPDPCRVRLVRRIRPNRETASSR